MPVTADSQFVTCTILSSPHTCGNTSTGNLLFLNQKPEPPPRAFPGRLTILPFPFVSHRPARAGVDSQVSIHSPWDTVHVISNPGLEHKQAHTEALNTDYMQGGKQAL